MSLTHPPGVNSGYLETIRAFLSGVEFDMLSFALDSQKTYGDFSFSRFGWISFYTLTDPELAHEILVNQANNFYKLKLIKYALGPFLGNGLLTSEGDFWKRQRKLSQPAFHTRRIENYAETMVDFARRMVADWKSGEKRFIDREMMKITLKIVAKTLFDADVSDDADRVGVLLTHILEASNERINAPFPWPEWLPSAKRDQMRRDVAELDAILQRFIDERRRSSEDRGDLLSMLLAAQDDDGSGMTDKQLRDELMTIFLAGHETTAMNLTWTWYLLSQHPQVVARLKEEVDTVLGERPATMADLAHLPYTEMVMKEALRLYPPAPSVGREPIEDVQVGGYTIPKGAIVNISIYAMHRNPAYFPDAETFDPERFSPEREKAIPRFAYLPFGAGPRICIGNSFAQMEARLILATMIQHVDLALLPGQEIVPRQLVTVRPRNGIEMAVTRREPRPERMLETA
ncbi:MAG: cytochrome P450 [Anaerolineae bacterium]